MVERWRKCAELIWKNRLSELLFVNSQLEWLYIQSFHLIRDMHPAKLSKACHKCLSFSLSLSKMTRKINLAGWFALINTCDNSGNSDVFRCQMYYTVLPTSKLGIMEERKQLKTVFNLPNGSWTTCLQLIPLLACFYVPSALRVATNNKPACTAGGILMVKMTPPVLKFIVEDFHVERKENINRQQPTDNAAVLG